MKKEEGVELEYFTLKVNYDEASFEREAYIALFSDVDVPENIGEAKFGNVKNIYWQYVMIQANYQLKYTVDIGRDRVEQYWADEKVWKDGHQVTQKVLKERTVTDWSPMSGEYSGEALSVGAISDPFESLVEPYEDKRFATWWETDKFEKYLTDAKRLSDVLEEYDEVKCEVKPKEPTVEAMDYAYTMGANEVAYSAQKGLPGDKHQKFSHTYESELSSKASIVAPAYALPFTYGEKKYAVEAYALDNETDLKYSPKENVTREQEEQTKVKRRLTRYIPMGALFALGVVFACCELTTLGTLSWVLAIGYVIAHWFVWLKLIDKQAAAIHEVKQAKKKEALETIFKKLGLEPLTETELARFDEWKEKKH